MVRSSSEVDGEEALESMGSGLARNRRRLAAKPFYERSLIGRIALSSLREGLAR